MGDPNSLLALPTDEPSDAVLETIKQLAGSGVPLSVKARHLGGFTRATAG